MGFFGYWLMVKGGKEKTLRRLGLEPYGEGQAPGWLFAAGGNDEFPDDFAGLVARASEEAGAAVGAYVYDSDFGYVVGAQEGEPTAEVIVNFAAAREYEFLADSDPDSFARWTEVAPRSLEPDQVREVLRQEWVFAEEGVEELLERAGLPAPYEPRARPEIHGHAEITVGRGQAKLPPQATAESVGARDFGGYEGPLGWMSESFFLGDQKVAWSDTRFVPGIGQDFLAIWDRERPEEPIQRFPRTSRGEDRLREELERLHEPMARQTLGLETLGGFRRPLESIERTVRVAERELPLREARFVPGRGEGFIGIWDRERPAEAVERFPDDSTGETRAYKLAYRLLFEYELARKDLPGRRLYLPRVPPRLVRRTVDDLAGARIDKGLRARLEESIRQGMYAETPTGPWLLTEEREDERWPPVFPPVDESGPWYLYDFAGSEEGFLQGPTDELALHCRGCYQSLEKAQAYAAHLGAEGEWAEVPDDVPRDLLSTTRWASAELAAPPTEAWFERFEPLTGDPELAGPRSFMRLFEPDGGILDAALVFAEEGHEGEPAVYLVRPGDEPRLVYALDEAGMLFAMLPNYLHERRFGEWRAISDEVPRTLRATAEWVLLTAGLR